jgi:tripartite-type tricarboxylate transporter receptor subunit TctC
MQKVWQYAQIAVAGVGCVPLAVSAIAQAQSYPMKPIRVIVPQSAGSASDTIARVAAQRMSSLLGQQMIVDNRPGAGGLTGTEAAARATPDGYTLCVASISSHGTVPALYRKLSYDAVKDFAPITLWVTIPNVLVVHPSVPAQSTKELIALARAKPGELRIGTQGNGSSQHLATELFKIMAGNLNTIHVPYKGSGASIIGVLTGEVAVLFPTLALSQPHIQAGKIRALAVTTSQRLEEMPHLPTVADTVPGFQMVSWIGLLATARTPRPIVSQLHEASVKALAPPEVRKTLGAAGMHIASTSPEEFGTFIQQEIAKWTKVARTAGIEAD